MRTSSILEIKVHWQTLITMHDPIHQHHYPTHLQFLWAHTFQNLFAHQIYQKKYSFEIPYPPQNSKGRKKNPRKLIHKHDIDKHWQHDNYTQTGQIDATLLMEGLCCQWQWPAPHQLCIWALWGRPQGWRYAPTSSRCPQGSPSSDASTSQRVSAKTKTLWGLLKRSPGLQPPKAHQWLWRPPTSTSRIWFLWPKRLS